MTRLLLALFCFYTLPCFGQNAKLYFSNYFCKDKDSTHLFVGVRNPIKIFAKGFDAGQYRIVPGADMEISNPNSNRDTLFFTITTYSVEDNTDFSIVNKENGIPYARFDCTLEEIRHLEAKLAPQNSIAKKAFLQKNKLKVSSSSSLFLTEKYYYIIGYELEAVNKGYGKIKVEDVTKTREVTELVKRLPPNTTLLYTNITATCADCAYIVLPDYEILVK